MGVNQHDVEFRFCPVCGGELDISIPKPDEPSRLICGGCEFIFYLDPKVVACTILEKDDKILLLKRGINPQKGKWVMPGGYVDRKEAVETAAVRETFEECNVRVRIEDLAGVYSYPGKLAVVIVYTARYLEGKLTPKDETQATEWFSEREIPWGDLAFRSTTDAVRDYFEIKVNDKAVERRNNLK